MSRIAKISIFLIVIAGILGITYCVFLYKSYVVAHKKEYRYSYPERDQKIITTPKQNWLNSLSEKKDFSYPATEASFNINFLSVPPTSHRFVIENLDSYIFFCLQEILEEKKIDFATNQNGRQRDVILYLPESKDRELLKMLDYYGIKYKNN